MARKKSVATGYDDLFGALAGEPNSGRSKAFASPLHDAPETPSASSAAVEIPIDQIRAGSNPRTKFNDISLQELADSIREHGVLQPVLVAPEVDGYLLIAGERRWRAAKLAERDTIPAVVRDLDEQQRLVLAMVENLQREDLNPVDRAAGLDDLKAVLGTWDSVAKATGLTTRSVLRLATINKLSDRAKDAIAKGTVAASAAAMLAEKLRGRKASAIIEDIVAARGGMTREEAQEILRNPNSDTVSSPKRVTAYEDELRFRMHHAELTLSNLLGHLQASTVPGTVYAWQPEQKARLVQLAESILALTEAIQIQTPQQVQGTGEPTAPSATNVVPPPGKPS